MSTRFEDLAGSYVQWWSTMVVNPAKIAYIDKRVAYLLRSDRIPVYQSITDKTGVPVVVIAAIHEREGSGSMSLSLAQGDPWNEVSRHEPRGVGPFKSFADSADFALHLDDLDRVGKGNWTISHVGYGFERFNGFGYRGHGVRSPYVVGGSNLQQPGKYVSDNHFVASVWDDQIGAFPMIARMLDLNPELSFGDFDTSTRPPAVAQAELTVEQIQKIVGLTGDDVDGSYGPKTKAAVREWQRTHNLNNDGIVGVATTAVMQASILAEVKA
jgi:lysozyme family protein